MLAKQLPPSSVALSAVVRSKSSMTNSRWEQENLPVAPVLSRSEQLPSNLKLAVEPWSEEEDEEQEDGERSDKACGRCSGSSGAP